MRLIVPLLLLLAGPAAAQDRVSVLSGEHPDFTRLVFPAERRVGWTVSREDRTATIAFDMEDLSFDLEGVFDRIPRTRLALLTAEGPNLSLTLACGCSIDVWLTGSRHVVIDIRDDPSPAQQEVAGPVLPRRLPPVGSLTLGFEPDRTAAHDGRSSPPRSEIPRRQGGSQVALHRQGPANLTPPTGTPPTPGRSTCAEEALAHAALRSDPVVSLASIPDLRASLVDEAGEPDAAIHRALARAYLNAGFGLEALRTIRGAPGPRNAAFRKVAIAIDALPGLGTEELAMDPHCGPASATLALLQGIELEVWNEIDEDAVRLFVEELPRATQADLAPRLQSALARLGRPSIAIRAPAPDGTRPVEALGAGSGIDAASEVIDQLGTTDGPEARNVLANAMALRRTVPDGTLRDELDAGLSTALVAEGFLREALPLMEDRPDMAAAALQSVLDRGPPQEAIVAAVELRSFLDQADPRLARAADLLEEHGLHALARNFAPGGDLSTDRDALELLPEQRAWIRRDFDMLDRGSTRGQLGALRLDRNAPRPALDDFDLARRSADDAARLAAIIAELIVEPETPSVTSP